MKKELIFIVVIIALGLILWGHAYFLSSNPTSTMSTTTPTDTTPKSNTPADTADQAILHTSFGDITIQLLPNKAPNAVDNFIKLSGQGFYDGTLFHRVIKDFMIQGGDPLTKSQPTNLIIHGTGGPGYTFKDEINDIKLVRGVVAMANAGPNTNGSQFFIITAPKTDWLQGSYTAFGRVIAGMETVDKIEAVKTNQNDHPLEDVKITSVELK